MLGAIAGDIIGSVYEQYPVKKKEFPLFQPRCCFTDDTVLTIGIAKAILEDRKYVKAVWETGRKYPDAGYGSTFIRWFHSNEPEPYNSWGNGAAMRVSPVGFAFDTVDTLKKVSIKFLPHQTIFADIVVHTVTRICRQPDHKSAPAFMIGGSALCFQSVC